MCLLQCLIRQSLAESIRVRVRRLFSRQQSLGVWLIELLTIALGWGCFAVALKGAECFCSVHAQGWGCLTSFEEPQRRSVVRFVGQAIPRARVITITYSMRILAIYMVTRPRARACIFHKALAISIT